MVLFQLQLLKQFREQLEQLDKNQNNFEQNAFTWAPNISILKKVSTEQQGWGKIQCAHLTPQIEMRLNSHFSNCFCKRNPLGLYTESSICSRVFVNGCSEKFHKVHRKRPETEYILVKLQTQTYKYTKIKTRTPSQVLSRRFCEMFQIRFFRELLEQLLQVRQDDHAEAYLEPHQTFKMELFWKKVNGFPLLTIFAKSSILHV